MNFIEMKKKNTHERKWCECYCYCKELNEKSVKKKDLKSILTKNKIKMTLIEYYLFILKSWKMNQKFPNKFDTAVFCWKIRNKDNYKVEKPKKSKLFYLLNVFFFCFDFDFFYSFISSISQNLLAFFEYYFQRKKKEKGLSESRLINLIQFLM